jgi:hypothetical protein
MSRKAGLFTSRPSNLKPPRPGQSLKAALAELKKEKK